MEEKYSEWHEDSDGADSIGSGYRVLKPFLRPPAKAFVVADLAEGGRRRLIRIAPDRPDVRAAADQARRVVHDRLCGLNRVETGPRGDLLLVGDVVEGETLAERLERLGSLHEAWIIEAMGGVARVVDQAHAMGVAHGDLRPDWLMIDEAGTISILGLAVEAAMASGAGASTEWQAPEVAAGGDCTPRADVYAFAAIIFACLNGRPPSLRGELDSVDALRSDDGEAVDSVAGRALRRAALRGLDRDPARRPATCGDLMSMVEAVMRDAAAAEPVPTPASSVGPDRVRVEYQTPLDLLDLESTVADVVPKKGRIVLKDHPAVCVRWDKGEHFLSSGAVYKQLQQWQAAGEALERARIEFDAALALDRGLVESRDRCEQLRSVLEGLRWADHPATREMRDRARAIMDGERSAWAIAWGEGRLDEAEERLSVGEGILHEARYLNREIASATEWQARWSDVRSQIPDRVLDHRWAEEIRDHRDACRRAEDAFAAGRFATAGGIWSTRVDRLAVILDRDSESWDGAMAARRRFDEAMSRAPKSRPITTSLRESLDRLLADSDRIEDQLVGSGRFEEATRRWTEAASSIGALVQQDIEEYGRVQTAMENFEKIESSGRPRRETWTRLRDEFAAIRKQAAAAATARESGDFGAAIENWTNARERLERAFAADLERHREALLACERFARRVATLPPRSIDRSVRADVDRLRKRHGVLDDWMAAGRFSEVEEAVKRAIDSIDKALEIDGRLHDAAAMARDRAVGVEVEFPANVPQPVLGRLRPLFTEIDGMAVQARQAFELGEYADCAEAWERTSELKNRATEALRVETERFERRRRRLAFLRAAGAVAAVIAILLAGTEFGLRAWFGSLRSETAGITIPADSTGLLQRRDELLAAFDDVLAGPSVGLNVLTGGLGLRAEPSMLEAANDESLALRNLLAGAPTVEVDDDMPSWATNEATSLESRRAEVTSALAAGELEGLADTISALKSDSGLLKERMLRSRAIRDRLVDLVGRRPDDFGGFAEIEQGWSEFGDLLEKAGEANAAGDLDEAEGTIETAGTMSRKLQLDIKRLAAERARDDLQDVWASDRNRSVIENLLDTELQSVETFRKQADASFTEEKFDAAERAWRNAREKLVGLIDARRGPLERYEHAREEWDELTEATWPTDFIRTSLGRPSFKSYFETAGKYAQEAKQHADDGDFQRAAESFDTAVRKWTATVDDVDKMVGQLWAKARADDDLGERSSAARWLADALISGSADQREARLLRDRLVWQTEPPRDKEIRVWPIDADRGIEMQFVRRNAPFKLPPGTALASSIRLSGYWISTSPIATANQGVEFDQVGAILDDLGASELIFRDGERPHRVRFRLPTEAEWYSAADKDLFKPADSGEWCRDRFVEDDWWLHLSDRDPGGPIVGEERVVRTSRGKTGRRGGGRAQVRAVLSPVVDPEVLKFADLEERRDPRLGGRVDPDVERTRRTIRIGERDGNPGVQIEFVSVPIAGDERLWVATTETTQAAWDAVMGDLNLRDCPVKGDDLPVVNVTDQHIEKFIRLIRADDRISLALPTPEQWEIIARAGGPGPYVMGGVETALHLDRFAWLAANAGGTYHPVGEKAPSIWGLHDVHGNVAERCKMDQSKMTAIRGGSYLSKREECRIGQGGECLASQASPSLGFRLVAEELPEQKD